jgi:hypothetical protein
MATVAIPPLLQPVNRLFIGLLSPPEEPRSRPVQALAAPKPLQDHPKEPALGAVLTSLVVGALAPFVVALWPLIFVLLVLVFVGLSPFIAIGTGVKAILRHGRRVNGAPVHHYS